MDEGRLPVERGLVSTPEDARRCEIIGELMCRFRLEIAAFEARHGIDFRSAFAGALEQLEPMRRDGLMDIDRGALTVTPTGRFLVRNVCMAFDAYLAPNATGFSRAI